MFLRKRQENIRTILDADRKIIEKYKRIMVNKRNSKEHHRNGKTQQKINTHNVHVMMIIVAAVIMLIINNTCINT